MEIVRAKASDADALTWIALAAKGYWGYPEEWIEQWREDLTVSAGFIRRNEVYVAVFGEKAVAFYALVEEDHAPVLEHLWVSPEWIGSGVGRALFGHAVRKAASLGATVMEIEAEPNAEGFYLRMGARRAGERVSEIDGQERVLPLMVVSVPGEALMVAGSSEERSER